MLRTRLPIILLAAIAAVGTVTAADAGKGKGKQVKYVGVHPIPKGHGGGICYIEAPHVHVFAPTDVKVQYRLHDGHYYFVGDPVAYGWDGPKHSYYGHHPVDVDYVVGEGPDHVEYCYLDGAHFHAYAPPPEVKFEVKSGAYWYVGDLPAAYVDARAELDPIDVVYEPIVYERPAVVVEAAPPAWVGFTVAAPIVVDAHPGRGVGHVKHGHVHGGVGVGVGVEVVAPTLSVEVGVPGVVIDGGHHHHHGKYKGKGKWKSRGHKSSRVRVRDHRR